MKPPRLLDGEAPGPGQAPREAMAADDETRPPSREEIAQLAYSYWEARGRPGGSPWEDWFRAERELKRRKE